MTIFNIIKSKLENFPNFRERRFRAKYLTTLALRELRLENKFKEGIQLTVEEMIDFARKYDSYRHEWDAVMREYPDLQGKDYKDKEKLEQEKQIEFGYEGGFNQKLKV
jgi:hypothetical protein